jgi:hypothetical protein
VGRASQHGSTLLGGAYTHAVTKEHDRGDTHWDACFELTAVGPRHHAGEGGHAYCSAARMRPLGNFCRNPSISRDRWAELMTEWATQQRPAEEMRAYAIDKVLWCDSLRPALLQLSRFRALQGQRSARENAHRVHVSLLRRAGSALTSALPSSPLLPARRRPGCVNSLDGAHFRNRSNPTVTAAADDMGARVVPSSAG